MFSAQASTGIPLIKTDVNWTNHRNPKEAAKQGRGEVGRGGGGVGWGERRPKWVREVANQNNTDWGSKTLLSAEKLAYE